VVLDIVVFQKLSRMPRILCSDKINLIEDS